MNVYLDIETIPAQGDSFNEYLESEKMEFKAPSGLTKGQACADLGLTGNDAKFTSKDDAIRLWEDKFAEEKAPEVAEEKWRKTSFDGSAGEIISIAWAIGNEDIDCSYRDLGQKEEVVIQNFFNAIEEGVGRNKQPFFVGQFIAGFDLKFIFHRAAILGIKPPFDLPFDGYHNRDFYCTQIAWAGRSGRMSQDNLCKVLGIQGKPDDIDGSKVWDFVKAGDVERVAEYNKDDVNKVRQIYKRLTFNN